MLVFLPHHSCKILWVIYRASKFHKAQFFLTQANGMYSVRQTAFCSSSVCSFTAPVFQETTQCESHYTADRQWSYSKVIVTNLSTLLQNTTFSVQKANFSTHIITGHHSAPGPASENASDWSLCATSYSYLDKRHLPGLLNEQMQFINLLANKWWDRVTASNDTLGFSKEREEENSVCCIYGWYVGHLHPKDVQLDITTILTVTEQDKSH